MKCAWVVLSAGVALGLASSPAWAEPSTGQGDQGQSTEQSAPAGVDQARVTEATQKLELAVQEQFTKGTIDRNELTVPIQQVLEALPESVRPHAQVHINQVLESAEHLAAQLNPEQRAQVRFYGAFGYPYGGAFGYGFPSYGGYGYGYPGYGVSGYGYPYYGGIGYGTGYSTGYSCQSVNGWGGCYGY